MEYPAGPTNSLLDVAGLRVGQFDRRDDGHLTGTTVVLAPDGGMTAGVDVRGGAPGTRETDLLHPTATAQRIHAVVLTGGSAYGLAAADGVATTLGAAGVGVELPGIEGVVPIVPAAVIFDLGRGGRFDARPGPEFGRRATSAAGGKVQMGCVGAGLGAVTAGIKGGLGTASATLPDGTVVAALVVTNAVGSPIDPRTGELLGARLLLAADGPTLRRPSEGDRDAIAAVIAAAGPELRTPSITDTTIGVVATSASLTKAQCAKMAATAHDGLARALNPVHTQFDGDTLFAASLPDGPVPDPIGFHHILCAAADVVTRALVRGLLTADTVQTPAGMWRSYRDLVPSAVM
ncbi:L-aminopeptidase/D-esterase [Nakamurella panacisegetis]|uniref:L-aminopeptidase/D-esterase n=1 Tax=Nakamurella panacisegetis TaxID=1090615 RepID=A0A1H0SFR5_9ACTN|nr:P1 family peptidase [Nakamurella panacisegetis]SDP40006.1 L-aminopeptidase/D-esterase [Nakamurella panacisegetis]